MIGSKTLIQKEVYNITSQKDIPHLSVEKIAQIISNSPKAISSYSKYELDQFPVKFRNVMEGTRKDLTLYYSIKGVKTIYKDPAEFEGIKFYNTFGYEESANITVKADYVSFFTRPKENISEHRIYQIGPKYSNKEEIHLNTLIKKYEKEGDITSTINTIRKLLEINPNDHKRWTHLGELLVKTEQYDNAIEACKKAIRLVGIFSNAWICLGMAYYRKGDTGKAKKFIEKTLEDDPSYLMALNKLAQIHFNEEEYDKSLEYCNQYLEYDFADNSKKSSEILKLSERIKKKLGIEKETPNKRSKTQTSSESVSKLLQRLHVDNKEYSEYLKHLNIEDLRLNGKGRVIDDQSLVFYRKAIINFFEKKFIKAFIDADKDNEDLRIFINDIFPKLVSRLEVFYGLDTLNSLITTILSNTKYTANIYTPLLFQELLSFVSEWGFKNEDKKIILYSFWEEDLYDRFFSTMVKLGNIQVRRLSYPYSFFLALRDEKEIILAPFSSNFKGIVSVKSTDIDFINFYKTKLIPILNGASSPMS